MYIHIHETNRLFRIPPLLGPPLSCAKLYCLNDRPREAMVGVDMVLAQYPQTLYTTGFIESMFEFNCYARTMFTPTMFSRRRMTVAANAAVEIQTWPTLDDIATDY